MFDPAAPAAVEGGASPGLLVGILAGGRGSRLGGIDKGLLERADGSRQIDWLLSQLDLEPSRLLISANRNLEIYRRTGARVVADQQPDYPGPLAGVAALLEVAAPNALLTLPIDVDGAVAAAVQALLRAHTLDPRHVHVLEDRAGLQPLLAVYPSGLAVDARLRLASDDRSMHRWLPSVGALVCRCPELVLGNLNRPEDLRAARMTLPDDESIGRGGDSSG